HAAAGHAAAGRSTRSVDLREWAAALSTSTTGLSCAVRAPTYPIVVYRAASPRIGHPSWHTSSSCTLAGSHRIEEPHRGTASRNRQRGAWRARTLGTPPQATGGRHHLSSNRRELPQPQAQQVVDRVFGHGRAGRFHSAAHDQGERVALRHYLVGLLTRQ